MNAAGKDAIKFALMQAKHRVADLAGKVADLHAELIDKEDKLQLANMQLDELRVAAREAEAE